METCSFYADLAPFYHLIYPDWEGSIQRQAAALHEIIEEHWGDGISSILDVSCGIGTQALGLAQRGYRVTASDLCPEAVERAGREAARRELPIAFSVADMRQAFDHHHRQFDLVVSCDNSVPHLLGDDEILCAFEQFFQCTRPGGGCLISVRDYGRDMEGDRVRLYGEREQEGARYFLFQVWDFHGPFYDLSMYVVEDRGQHECKTHVMRAQYYAVGTDTLIHLLEQAGFVEVKRLDGRFFQPVIVGRRRA